MGLIAVTDSKLDAFDEWMRRRGLSDGTMKLYRRNLRRCGKTSNLTDRLRNRDLAPKTRHTNKASLAAWAKFTKDAELKEELEELRLPPGNRMKPKSPLQPSAWASFIRYVRTSDKIPAHVRAILLIMALRGLRISDVLRMKRKDCVAALRTGRLIYEGKGNKRPDIAVAQIREPVQMLVDASSDWKTVTNLFGDLSMDDCGQVVRRAQHKIGETLEIDDCHPHRLRRTYAVEFLKANKGDPQALVKLVAHMGWSGIQVASGYVDDVDRDELERVGANVVKGL